MKHRNTFLGAMSSEDLGLLSPLLAELRLERGLTLHQAGDPIKFVYFPTSAVVSVVTPMKDGRSVESVTVGFEGVAGLSSALSGVAASSRAFVQIAGTAYRLPAIELRRLVRERDALAELVFRHLDAATGQAEQSVACNALHNTQARLARWLLMTQDRVGIDELRLTQEYLSTMLGVQRTTVTETAKVLKKAGLIQYMRGKIVVLDRDGLERESCECYDAGRERLRAVLGLPEPPGTNRAA